MPKFKTSFFVAISIEPASICTPFIICTLLLLYAFWAATLPPIPFFAPEVVITSGKKVHLPTPKTLLSFTAAAISTP